ncbi:Chromate resistance protein ChrB [Nocardia vaccinii]|uniref:Chromate resistance protein ChrB n=1 Tax=Nocardia vaccinii TaxID=1822 RepID=UPI00082DD3F9|nr:Chromate resistance protein ChrB [Nocardia vaccinii]
MADGIEWLLLVYRVPTEPTRHRAAVWRRLKALGAVYLQNSVAALPASTESERALRVLRNDIREMRGTAQLLRADALAGQEEIVAAVNAARDEEYAEVFSRCRDFLAEIAKETAAEKFTYAELEENDEDLTKLRAWFDKIRARDRLAAAGQAGAQKALDECATALEGFAERVYAAELGQP